MSDLLRVWKGLSKRGRCRRCRSTILWAMTKSGKWIPLKVDALLLHTEVDPGRGTTFQVYDWSAVHPKTCTPKTKTSAHV